jgi:hypothetical protein
MRKFLILHLWKLIGRTLENHMPEIETIMAGWIKGKSKNNQDTAKAVRQYERKYERPRYESNEVCGCFGFTFYMHACVRCESKERGC